MKNKFQYLSHTLSNETVGYGGKKDFQSTQTQSLLNGQTCNQSEWRLNNHIGTHIDSPSHFTDSGRTLDQFVADSWVFQQVHLVNLSVKNSQLLDEASWCEQIPVNTELLLIKTGFEEKRDTDDYWQHNPGITPQLGLWLRTNRPSLRAIGFDFISLTSFDHRPLGKEAHRVFLGSEYPGNPILIIEDMHLQNLQQSPKQVIVLPLRVRGTDGSPVTIISME